MTRGPALAVSLVLLLAVACDDPQAPDPTPEPTPTATATATPRAGAPATATPAPTRTPTAIDRTSTPVPSLTPTPEVVRPDLIDPAARVCISAGDGFFRATLRGAVERELDWGNTGTNCSGAGIVGVEGWQQSFGRTEPGGERLDVLFSIGGAAEGGTGEGFPVRLTVATVIDGESVLFVTPVGGCSIDITEQAPLSEDPLGRVYRVTAQGACAEPATELDGERSVEVPDFAFTGVTGWLS